MALRWFLGMAESAFFPLVIYYQTTFYRRGELARRLAIFYAASNIANAFGGLLSWAVFRIDSGPLASWRYLFIIEGSLTITFAVWAYWYLPYNSQTARFLTPEEKDLAFYRMQMDSSSIVDQKFDLKDAAVIFKHPTTWIILGIEMCLGVPLQVSSPLDTNQEHYISCFGFHPILSFTDTINRVWRCGCRLLSLVWATGRSRRTCIQWLPM
jgi:MFS family permease